MKKLALFIVVMSLAGCTAHQPHPVVQCDSIGIDFIHPDFYQKHKLADIDRYYTCMESQVRTEAYNEYANMNIFTKLALSQQRINPAAAESQRGEKAAEVLEYQRNLWRQVIRKEKKPGAAYETWMQWVQNERNINATNQAAAASAHAASAAESAADAARNAANAANAANRPTNTTCMANGPFLNCNSY